MRDLRALMFLQCRVARLGDDVRVCMGVVSGVILSSRVPAKRMVFGSVVTTSAASFSLAIFASFAQVFRGMKGASSSTTRWNTPLCRRISVALSACSLLAGRMATKRLPSVAHGAGASVWVVSTHATHWLSASVFEAISLRSAVLPAPVGAESWVILPRGIPPLSWRSRGVMPVVSGGLCSRLGLAISLMRLRSALMAFVVMP